MTVEPVFRSVTRWVRLYTGGLPADVARRRIEEIDADLHDHCEHLRSAGVPDHRIARAVALRAVRGAVSDIVWRRHQYRIPLTPEDTMSTTTKRSVLRIAAFVGAVLLIPLVGMAVSDEVVWSGADFALAAVMLGVIGVCFEAAVRRRGTVLLGAAVVAAGTIAAVVGELDDAPGLVLLGLLMIVGGVALTSRRMQRRPVI